MSPSVDALCSTCETIDFKSLIYTLEVGSVPRINIQLGNLESIIQRADKCQLCALILDALRERYKRTPSGHMSDVYYGFKTLPIGEVTEEWIDEYLSGQAPDPWKADDVQKYGLPLTWSDEPIVCHITPSFLCSQRNLVDAEDDKMKAQGDHNQDKRLRVSRLGVKLSPSPWVTFSGDDAVKLQVVWDKGQAGVEDKHTSQPISPLGSGRRVGPLIEPSTIRGWLRQCEEEHGDCCASPAWVSGGQDESWVLRVIDVKERRVVYLPPKCRYIALSYVWGYDNHALESRLDRCLTSRNSAQLQKVNGLDRIAVPRTVQDAMSLTLDLKERYLWVDALCILQDDMSDLSVQTSQMDLVYSGAVLTVLAACGENSEAGLAGMAAKPRDIFYRHVRVSPEGLCLATTAALSRNDTLPSSRWSSRGWTFQERLLSRRVLVFTASQVYWLCDRSMWDEEIILEPSEPPVWILPQALGCNDEWDDGYAKFSKEALAVYIAQYSKRQFTFPADVLPAFLGIIRRYEHLNKEKIHWGLPTERFDQSLIWEFGIGRREELYRVVEGSLVRDIPYPSWSWLGWTGFIGAKIYNRELANRTRTGDSKSELIFYSLMSDGTVRPVDMSCPEAQSDDCPKDRDSAPKWKGVTTIAGPITDYNGGPVSQVKFLHISETDLKLDPVYDTGHLVFWTSHAQNTAWLKDRMGDTLYVDTGDGILELDAGFSSDEVLSLVLNTPPSPPRVTALPTPVNDLAKHIMNFIVISRYYNICRGEETGKLNIMIIKESKVEPGIWSRVGITVMEEKDWLRLERSWKMVILE
ncbi:hypothetical protein MRS44_016078 [Fusarium solani]|uniref:uncharacterized protein n=1 Tax=Fusarium solani TaxID=169388 RepID=UPI0032C44C5B|nr:hypothetical protein MRS44_016078 [Fusarium solani]